MKQLGRILKRDVSALCVAIFLADVVAGVASPTFSLFATTLGASLTVIGLLGGLMGLTQILSSVPLGILSDRRGRKNVLSAGMVFFAASTFLYTVSPNVLWLFPARVLAGLAQVATFFIGMAYIGDLVAKEERGLAIGLYSTCMALGFAVGPIIGGSIAANYGYVASYQVAVLIALAGLVITHLGLADRRAALSPTRGARTPLSAKLGLMIKEPNLLVASLANLVFMVVFSGAVVNFFPLYAASFSIGDAAISSMFSVRAFMSTLTRIPTGLLTTRFSSRNVMIVSLALGILAMFGISSTALPFLLAAFLAIEGVSFGMFLTSGQAFVIEHSTESDRGTAMGIYSMAGSIGATAGPFVLGLIADAWGLGAVFQATGILVGVGVVMLGAISVWTGRMSASEADLAP